MDEVTTRNTTAYLFGPLCTTRSMFSNINMITVQCTYTATTVHRNVSHYAYSIMHCIKGVKIQHDISTDRYADRQNRLESVLCHQSQLSTFARTFFIFNTFVSDLRDGQRADS